MEAGTDATTSIIDTRSHFCLHEVFLIFSTFLNLSLHVKQTRLAGCFPLSGWHSGTEEMSHKAKNSEKSWIDRPSGMAGRMQPNAIGEAPVWRKI